MMNQYADEKVQRNQGRPAFASDPNFSQKQETEAGTNPAHSASVMIEKSHQRSAAYGLATNAEPDFSGIGRADLALLIEQNRVLHTYALPVMETLYEQI